MANKYIIAVGVRQTKECFTQADVIQNWGASYLEPIEKVFAKQKDEAQQQRDIRMAKQEAERQSKRVVGMPFAEDKNLRR